MRKIFIVEGVVAICPTSNAEIIETETHYTANNKSKCKIHIPREISGREITREEAKQLIETNSIGPFQDFKSKKTGNPFAASLHSKKKINPLDIALLRRNRLLIFICVIRLAATCAPKITT